MKQLDDIIYKNIANDMSSALVVLNTGGYVQYFNPVAGEILGLSAEDCTEKPFVQYFFLYETNDQLIQLILDAVYEKNRMQEGIVPFEREGGIFVLRVKTSYLFENGKHIGIICMMDDITELYDLKDAVKAMNQIKRLNDSLSLRNRLIEETFGRFLSDTIVKQLLETEDGLKLGGKKRRVSVLMSDLRGFTALSEQMSPEHLIRMLNHYLGTMTEIIQDCRGTIIEFIGDGIMALFSAPEEYPDHAEKAVVAAVRMQVAMKDVNRWNQKEGYPKLEMGIGIHTGDAVIGNIGSEQRTKYGAVGNNINLAGRIESYTVGGQILISEDVLEAAGTEIMTGETQVIRPKGVGRPVTIYEVTGLGDPYHLSVQTEREEISWKSVKALPVSFMKLSGKMKEGELLTGWIRKVSDTGMVLKTGAELARYDNLCLEAGGELYVKVIGKSEQGEALLRFTSVPVGFENWKRKLTEV